MDCQISPSHPLNRLFRGLIEQTFQSDLGICDPELVGYVCDLLVRFVPAASLYTAPGGPPAQVGQLNDLLATALHESEPDRRKGGLRHAGDVSLFLSGLFPGALAVSRDSVRLDYTLHGKRSYFLASTFCESPHESSLLLRLSHDFEPCVLGLGRVRKEWESMPGQLAVRARPPLASG